MKKNIKPKYSKFLIIEGTSGRYYEWACSAEHAFLLYSIPWLKRHCVGADKYRKTLYAVEYKPSPYTENFTTVTFLWSKFFYKISIKKLNQVSK